MTISVHFPRDAYGKRFCQLFTHRFNFIEAPVVSEGKPQWRTIKEYPIEHRNLWSRFLDPDTLIGLSFGSTTNYVVIDIDRGSPYHPYNNEHAYRELLGAYEDVGFNEHLLVQSSWSEGIHVYFLLPEPVPTYKLAVMMKLVATRSGFTVKDGWLEIFPNPKHYNKDKPTNYKAHRLPLQYGSFLLDNDYQPYSNSIYTFLDQVQEAAAAQDIELIEKAIEAAVKVRTFRPIKGDPDIAKAFAKDLMEQICQGWTDFGQTNDLLRIIGTYGRVFEKLGGEKLANYIAECAQKLPGYREYCRHKHQIEHRAVEWARCVEKFYYPYGSAPARRGTFAQMVEEKAKENQVNRERQESAIERIKKGVEHIKEKLAEMPKRIGELKESLIKAIVELFGVRPSDKTLNRYRDIWYPQLTVQKDIPQEETEAVAQDIQPEDPSGETELEEPAHNILQVEQRPEEGFSLCHTPLDVAQEALKPETLHSKDSEELATPPLYMKVGKWISEQPRLVYRGSKAWSSTVQLKGERYLKLQSINPNEEVFILPDEIHSSFLFRSDDEQNLQVYVKPLENSEHWLTGISVLAKDLQVVPDG